MCQACDDFDEEEREEINQMLFADEIIFSRVYDAKRRQWQYHADFPDGDFAIIHRGPEIDAKRFALDLWGQKNCLEGNA